MRAGADDDLHQARDGVVCAREAGVIPRELHECAAELTCVDIIMVNTYHPCHGPSYEYIAERAAGQPDLRPTNMRREYLVGRA